MNIQKDFDVISGGVEWFLSRWWGVALYLVACVLSFVAWGWDGLDRVVYTSGTVFLVLLIGGARRSSKAMHVKLDDIDERDDLNRIEDLCEEEIERKRND